MAGLGRSTLWVTAAAALLLGVTASAASNAIVNGDFSQGITGWKAVSVKTGSFPGYPHIAPSKISRCDPTQASSNQFLTIDVPGGAKGYLEQKITVPTAGATLTFLTWGNLSPVTASIVVVSAAGPKTLLSYTPPLLQATVSTCTGRKPETESVDLSAYAGQSVTLRVEGTASGFDGTIADFDNFQLGGASSGPSPVLAQSLAGSSVSGSVTVRKPGTTTFVPLSGAELVTVGSVVDATNGRVKLIAQGAHGTYSGEFYGGEFTVSQDRSGLTDLTLTGGSACAASAAAGTRPVARKQKLWGVAHGSFKTTGHYAAATVLGTQWLTQDTCTATLVHVKTGEVRVADLVKHRSFVLRAPHSYTAHP